ncbi:cwf21 domain-containing protein [Peziza echinospora]|nr:cwf21 domain-containing protein [Peziza echinospora]
MSSNVGLTTPRGSGTSGYVQRNLSHLKPRQHTLTSPYPLPSSATSSNTTQRLRQPDKSILEHERKRAIEVQCFALRDELEEKGELDEDEIDEQVDELRKKLAREGEERGTVMGAAKGLKRHQVHELAEAKLAENARMEKALGIASDYEEGSHWQKQAQRKIERELGGGGNGGSKNSDILRE